MTAILTLILALSAVGTPVQAVKGYATWYDDGPGHYAAAGPAFREAFGPDWRGRTVRVTSAHGSTVVVVSDWCACRDRRGLPTVLDLSLDAFMELGDPTLGVIKVTVEALPGLPATDTGFSPTIESLASLVNAQFGGME